VLSRHFVAAAERHFRAVADPLALSLVRRPLLRLCPRMVANLLAKPIRRAACCVITACRPRI